MSSSGRVATPELSSDRIEELAALRTLIEVELASRALPRAHFALIERLQTINNSMADVIARGDAVAYIRTNLEFHRTLYLRAQAPAMLAMTETVWLQLGPTMRQHYGRLKRKALPPYHKMIMNDQIPLSIGGGIGQSRTYMYFLRKAHLGECSVTVWPKILRDICADKNIHVLQ